MQLVARAAHDFANVNNDLVFNLSQFNRECRKMLYNTERNVNRRKSADNASVSQQPPPPTTPKPPTSPTSEDSLAADADEFFNFRRASKKPSDVQSKPDEKKEESFNTEAVDDEVDKNMAGTSGGMKREGSPVKPPVAKRSMPAYRRASVMDHLKSVVDDEMSVDEILKLLRAYHRSLHHRKGFKLACKDLKLFIQEVEENDGEDDILEIANNYNIALTKLPAILE